MVNMSRHGGWRMVLVAKFAVFAAVGLMLGATVVEAQMPPQVLAQARPGDLPGIEPMHPQTQQNRSWQAAVDQLIKVSNQVMEAPNANYKFDACFLKNGECAAHSPAYRDAFRELTYYYAPSRHNIAKSHLGFYLSVKDGRHPDVVMRVVYFGSEWLYMDRVTVLMNGRVVFEKTLPAVQVKREALTGTQVYEYGDVVLTADMKLLRQLADRRNAVAVRMSGRGGETLLDARMLENVQMQAQEIVQMYEMLEDAINHVPSNMTI